MMLDADFRTPRSAQRLPRRCIAKARFCRYQSAELAQLRKLGRAM